MVSKKVTEVKVKKAGNKPVSVKKPVKSAKTVKKAVSKNVVPKKATVKKVLTAKEQKEVEKIVKEISTKKPVKVEKKAVSVKKPVKSEAKTNNVIHDEMVGRKFGHITVLERAGSTIEGRAIYTCGCDCGTVFLAAGTAVRIGRIKSCGCQGGHVKRKHYISNESIKGALSVLNQMCVDYSCSQSCPLWESCHNKVKGTVKQFSANALKEMENRKE